MWLHRLRIPRICCLQAGDPGWCSSSPGLNAWELEELISLSFSLKSDRFETREEWTLQVWRHVEADGPAHGWPGKRSFPLTLGRDGLFIPVRPPTDWMRPTTLGKAIYFTQFTDSDVHLIPKHTCTPNNVWTKIWSPTSQSRWHRIHHPSKKKGYGNWVVANL